MNNQEKLELAKNVFNVEISAMEMMRDSLDDVFVQIVDLISDCKGKVVLTGMGKPGHISRKIAATLASLGTPSFYLHPAEAQHGDLGMVSSDDIVIAISYSGESSEVIRLLPNLRIIGKSEIVIHTPIQDLLTSEGHLRANLTLQFREHKVAVSLLAPLSQRPWIRQYSI